MKTILITGSSRGIGAGIAKYFGALGYHVLVTYYKSKEKGESVVKDIIKNGGKANLFNVDVRSESSVKAMYKAISNITNTIDVLVNNSAVDFLFNIEDSTFKEWNEIVRTKVDGNFLCTKYAIPFLKKSDNPNIIILMSSVFETVDSDDCAYSVGTSAVVAFMKCMALYLSKYRIRTNAIGPSEVKTDVKYWKQVGTDKFWKKVADKNPQKRLCTPMDVAYAIESIVDKNNEFINGNIVYVTGGKHLL